MAETRTDEGFFTARDGVRLFWHTSLPTSPPRGRIALVHGYADHLGRYVEVTDALVKAGYAVHRFDCRGHGQSAGVRAHVDKFDDYLSDLELFLARVREEAKGAPLFIVAHSHGSLIAARYLLDHDNAVRGVVLGSPYFRLKLAVSPVKIFLGKLVARVHPALRMSNELNPAQLTRDPAIQERTAKDPLYIHFATPGWFVQSSAAQEVVLRRATEFVTPVLCLHGAADGVADPAATREFFDAATSKDKTFKSYDGLVHELFHEPERETVFADVVGWLDARLQPVEGRGAAAGARP